MFTKKVHVDVKKSSLKVLDTKKDSLSRLKHLRILLDHLDPLDAKNFFEYHYSHIYYIFFDTLSSLEGSFKNKGQKQAKEELDSVLFIFEKILVFLPELIRRRWQFHSISIVLKKLLHPANSIKVRQEGIRCFVLWFQILGPPVNRELKYMFESLVPLSTHHQQQSVHHPNQHPHHHQHHSGNGDSSHTVLRDVAGNAHFYDPTIINEINYSSVTTGSGSPSSISAIEIEPLVPSHPSDPIPKDITCFYLQCLMDMMVSQVKIINWKEQRESEQMKCFQFLFDQFKESYIQPIFGPSLKLSSYSVYDGSSFDILPSIRSEDDVLNDYGYDENTILNNVRLAYNSSNVSSINSPINARSVIIRWLAKYVCRESELLPREILAETSGARLSATGGIQQNLTEHALFYNPVEWRVPAPFEYEIVQQTICSSRSNVNLLHELFRQTFLLPFSQSLTMRQVISVYKEWINCSNRSNQPLFLEEPQNHNNSNNDTEIRLGLSNVLRAFITNAAHIFLQQIPSDRPMILEEQVEMCKRVLNIYRFMVMKVEMDRETWEQLLQVMLRITSLVLSKDVPIRKEETLGGRLAPAFFQTLIVTWIRANLNVFIPVNLWEDFQNTMMMLTEWEELIREWSKTMDTITRVMCRYVYNINLHDLPLDRLYDQKKRRGAKFRENNGNPMKPPDVPQTSHTSSSISPNEMNIHHAPHPHQNRSSSSSFKTPQRKRLSACSSTQRIRSKILSRHHHIHSSNLLRSPSDSHLFVDVWRRKRPEYKNGRNQKTPLKSTRSKSLEHLTNRRSESPDPASEVSSIRSRSPSPTPSSSGMDSTSLKDSPLNLDGVSLNSNTSGNNSSSSKCVISGGSYRGWSSDSAVVLWRRMLGVLGDVNQLSNPNTHSAVMECLAKIIDDLIKVKDNLGVAENHSPPPPPLVPPIGYFSPWLLKCLMLPDEYKRGKMIALRSLCQITLRRHEIPPSPDFMCHFFKMLFDGLNSKDMDMISTIVRCSSGKVFSMGLSGSTCLLNPLLDVSSTIISSDIRKETETSKLPRSETLSLLGTIIGMSSFFEQIQKVFQPDGAEKSCKDVKDRVLSLLIRGSKKELSVMDRSLALNCLGMFMYQELGMRINHSRLMEVTNILLAATQYNDRVLSRIGCDMLRLQSDHAVYLLDNHPDIPRRIIQGLTQSLTGHLSRTQNDSVKDFVLPLIMCLGEWCLAVPQDFLKSSPPVNHSSPSLLTIVISTLSIIASGGDVSNSYSTESLDIDFAITQDVLGVGPRNSPTLRPGLSRFRSATDSTVSPSTVETSSFVKIAAKFLLGYLINHLGHFPRLGLGASRLNCFLNEGDDNIFIPRNVNEDKDELSAEIIASPNTLFFVVNDSSIMSFTEISYPDTNTEMIETKVRIIYRDLSGKFSWDCSQLMQLSKDEVGSDGIRRTSSSQSHRSCLVERNSEEYEEAEPEASGNRTDVLESVMEYIGQVTPECVSGGPRRRGPLNSPIPASTPYGAQAEENMIALLLNQHYQEMNYMEQHQQGRDAHLMRCSSVSSDPDVMTYHQKKKNSLSPESAFFSNCRRLIDQLGFISWEKRRKVDLLGKTDRVLRELRNLDNQKCRETHKIAVIYVASGQEDKNSILLNTSGSTAFESFVSGLGWEIDLETHLGFMGGLQSNGSTGSTAPYYSTGLMEVIYHVSTRIPASLDDSESMTRKLRHLGNDEIHIVWSEHWKDYRRGIIPTEFGDVLIIIYPVPNKSDFYRIHITRKAEVPFFGPLYNGSVVHLSQLSGLVRSTAINASRAQRINVAFYQNFFEERSRSIDTIVKNKDTKCFEDFVTMTYAPAPLGVLTPPPPVLPSRPSSIHSSSVNQSPSHHLQQPQYPHPDTYSSSGKMMQHQPQQPKSPSVVTTRDLQNQKQQQIHPEIRRVESVPSPKPRINRPVSTGSHVTSSSSAGTFAVPQTRLSRDRVLSSSTKQTQHPHQTPSHRHPSS